MPRHIQHREQSQQSLLRGMDAVADLVGSTLGPMGHTVLLSRPVGPPLVTKDGVTVAEGISVADPWENEGAKLIQQVARKTNTEAGDGTTAATVLARALYREGLRHLTAGADSQALERGMRRAAAEVVRRLRSAATPVAQSDLETLRAVATVAANGDREMGAVIAEAVHHAGVEGNYTLDPSPTLETTWEKAQGLQFQRGLDKWPQFMNDPRGMAVFGAANIFLTDRHLIDANEMGKLLSIYRAALGQVPLLIVAEDISQGALQVLTVNQGKTVAVCPVRLPGSGLEKKEFLEDMAILTGARALTVARGDKVDAVGKDDFGSADRVLVTPYKTTIIGGHGATGRVEMRLTELRERIADKEAPEFVRAGLERRLAALSAKIAIIKIGAGLHSKLLEKRDRAEDSLNATVGALKEGVLPGGGVALLHAEAGLRAWLENVAGDEKLGALVVASALAQPLRTLAQNAGLAAELIVENVRHGSGAWGLNASTGGYEDLVAAGIIDPARVVRLALENSVELAGLLLTCSGAVVDLPDPRPPAEAAALRGRP